jgi:hypothetical protein
MQVGFHARLGRRMSAAAAATVAIVIAGAGTASATTFDETINYHGETMQCGFYVNEGICGFVQLINPVSAHAGDQFHITVNSTTRVGVPGSKSLNGFYVDAFDANATNGPGGPGPIKTNAIVNGSGIQTSAGVPPANSFSPMRSTDYIGYLLYGGTYGVPNTGFSVTGLDARLNVVTPDANPTIGVSFGYFWQTENAASVLSITGGTQDTPVILPSGLIGQINSSIGGDGGPTEQFYNFNWLGGAFQTRVTVNGADPDADFLFTLRSLDGAYDRHLTLNSTFGFSQLFSDMSLLSGRYLIGLSTGNVADPEFSFDFLTPIGLDRAVPEPATWAMMILGLGAAGGMLRRRRTATA